MSPVDESDVELGVGGCQTNCDKQSVLTFRMSLLRGCVEQV